MTEHKELRAKLDQARLAVGHPRGEGKRQPKRGGKRRRNRRTRRS